MENILKIAGVCGLVGAYVAAYLLIAHFTGNRDPKDS